MEKTVMNKSLKLFMLLAIPVSALIGCSNNNKGKMETKSEGLKRFAEKLIKPYDNSDQLVYQDEKGHVFETFSGNVAHSYRGAIPTKKSDRKYHYDFDGWNVYYDSKTKNTVAKATFKEILNEYEITFMDGNKVVSKGKYAYGTMPEVPEGYEASCAIKSVFGDYTYHAKTRVNEDEYYSDGLIFALLDDKEEFAVVDCYGNAENIVIPELYQGIPVTTIVSNAFIHNPDIKSFSLPKTINNIEPNAFKGLEKVGEVSINPENQMYFLDSAGCVYYVQHHSSGDYNHLAYVPSAKIDFFDLGNNYPFVDDGAFTNTNINIIKGDLNGILSFYDAFGYDYNVKVNTIIMTAGYITHDFCKDMEGLYSFTICEVDESVDEDDYGTFIEERAFEGCTNLRGISIPNHIVRIADSAFKNCTSLKDVVLGFDELSIEEVSANAFEGCDALKGYTYQGIDYLGNAIHPYQIPIRLNNDLPQDVVIAEETLVIPNRLFEGNLHIKSLAFENPENSRLKAIGERAFYNCANLVVAQYNSLKIFPTTIEKLGKLAFANTKNPDPSKSQYIYYYSGGSAFGIVYLRSNISTLSLYSNLKFIDGYGARNGFEGLSIEGTNNNFDFHKNKIIMKSGTLIKASKTMTSITSNDFQYGSLAYCGEFGDYSCYNSPLTNVAYLSASGSISRIGVYAFSNCQLNNTNKLPTQMQYIGDGAFKQGLSQSVTFNITYYYGKVYRLEYVGDSAFQASYRFTLNFAGSSIPETWHRNFDGKNGMNENNTYNFNYSF